MSRRAPGEGSISRRKDGLWQASLQVAGVRRTVYARTEGEARRKLADLRKQAAVQGALPDGGRRTLDDLLDAWLAVKAPNWRPRTLQDWRYVCDVHLRPSLGRVRLSKLSPERVQHHLLRLEALGHRRTALKVYRALRAACALAVRWGWLVRNPCDRVDPPRYRPERRGVWTPQQVRAFLDGTEDHWLHPLWCFLVATGCRLGEALGLTWEDVGWQGSTVAVRRALQRVDGEWLLQEPKTRASERTLTLPPEGMRVLRRQRAQQAEWRLRAGARWDNERNLVFTGQDGRPLHQATVTCALRQECQRLGLPPLTPHGLRHLHASLLLDAGLPLPQVAQRLGHANTQVTASVYSHALRGEDGAAAAIGRVLAGEGR